jgi:hypothetical protein
MEKGDWIKKIVVSVYLIYMILFFKTRISVHHPLESYLLKGRPSWIQHPISTGRYENKICSLGHWTAIALVIWIWCRRGWWAREGKKWVWGVVIVVGLCLNLNFVLYLLPIVICENGGSNE